MLGLGLGLGLGLDTMVEVHDFRWEVNFSGSAEIFANCLITNIFYITARTITNLIFLT